MVMNDFTAEYAAVLSMQTGCETISLTQGEYLQKANELSESAVTGVVLRIGSPYFDELTKAGFQEVAVLALLLKREDEQLNEWRQTLAKIRSECR